MVSNAECYFYVKPCDVNLSMKTMFSLKLDLVLLLIFSHKNQGWYTQNIQRCLQNGSVKK
jgi:hypothetical protein